MGTIVCRPPEPAPHLCSKCRCRADNENADGTSVPSPQTSPRECIAAPYSPGLLLLRYIGTDEDDLCGVYGEERNLHPLEILQPNVGVIGWGGQTWRCSPRRRLRHL